MTERTLSEMLQQYKEWSTERDANALMIKELELQIKKKRTEIASQVLSAIDENGRKIYGNDMLRSTEIDRRAFMDEQIEKWQQDIWNAWAKQRDAEREMQILKWQIEARIASPRVM